MVSGLVSGHFTTPVVNYLPGGTPLARWSLAVTRSYSLRKVFSWMSYARPVPRRRKPVITKKRPWLSKMQQVARVAYTTARTVNKMSRLLDCEQKITDIYQSLTPDSTTGSVYCLTALGQGDTESTRSGNTVLFHSLYIKMALTPHASATGTFIRYMLVVDKASDSASPVSTDILENVDITGFLKHVNSQRFGVIRDKVYHVSPDGKDTAFIRDYVPLNMKVHYDGTTSSDNFNNGVYIFLLSNEPTNTPTVNLRARKKFYDN